MPGICIFVTIYFRLGLLDFAASDLPEMQFSYYSAGNLIGNLILY